MRHREAGSYRRKSRAFLRGLLGMVIFASAAPAQSAGSFIAIDWPNVPRIHHSATLLANGKVWIVSSRWSQVYDPETGMFADLRRTGAASDSVGAFLADGRVL